MSLLEKGVHPTLVSEAFQVACDKAIEVLKTIAIPVDLNDREALINAAMTYALLHPLRVRLCSADPGSIRYVSCST